MGLPAAFRCVPAALLLTALLGACGESPPVTAVESPLTPGAGPQPAPMLVEHRIDSELINESSGLARSQRRGDVLWTLNDSGGATELYALSTEGRLLATLRIQGVPANLDCIYGQPPEARFAAAMQLLGFDPLALSGEAGHA